jgi:hypothetical protein
METVSADTVPLLISDTTVFEATALLETFSASPP